MCQAINKMLWNHDSFIHELDEERDRRAAQELIDQERADEITAALKGSEFVVFSVKRREQRRRPSPPFITSTLQQDAARRLRFSVKRAMAVAQQLYEGIDIGGDTVGLITYMRTDSVRVSAEAIEEVRDFIPKFYSAEALPAAPNTYKTKSSAQDAHEAIRPTSVNLHPDQARELLGKDQARIYELIWKRFVDH